MTLNDNYTKGTYRKKMSRILYLRDKWGILLNEVWVEQSKIIRYFYIKKKQSKYRTFARKHNTNAFQKNFVIL